MQQRRSIGYHWGGAIELTLQVITSTYLPKEPDLLTAIKLLEETGAGVRFVDRDKLKSDYPDESFIICRSRNDGIIGITESDIEETRYWEEGRVTIDIVNKTVKFECVRDDEEEGIDEELNTIDCNDDLVFSYDEFIVFSKAIMELYAFKTKSGKVICLIA